MARVSDQAAERLLEELVSISSPSGQEAEAAKYLVAWMAERGFGARVDDAGSAVGHRGSGDRDIMLLGHIDTFPGELEVRRAGRILHGRGTVDAKGPLAAFAVAAANVQPPPGVRWVIVGASEEEAPSSRGARHIMHRYQPVYCVIGEPSGWDRVCLGYKGRLNLRWYWRGPLAHSSGPAATPAEQAVRAWTQVEEHVREFNDSRRRGFDQLQASLQQLNSDHDGAHGEAWMEVALRLPPGLTPESLQEELDRALTGAELDWYGQEAAYEGGKNNALTRSLLSAIRKCGGRPRFVLKSGTSDMNVVAREWDCPLAAYGPGDSHLDHTPDEHVDLDEFLRSIRVLEAALKGLAEAV